MAAPSLESSAISLPRRDRLAIVTALIGVAAVSWLYLIRMAAAMKTMSPDMDMAGMDMAGMMQMRTWAAADFLLIFLMWAIMMVGMMVPSAIPMSLIYAAVARKAAGQGTPLAPTAVFVSGYVLIWTFFSGAATIAQWGLDQAALLSHMMVVTSPKLGASILILAGVYQMTPAKNACLQHCRTPAHFISKHWRQGAWGAFQMGIVHGAYCLGCCWALMILLFSAA